MAATALRRSRKDRLLFGVCGGLAEYLNVDPVLVRLVFVLLTFVGGAGVIAYVVLAIIMPQAESASAEPAKVVRENLQSIPTEAAEAGKRLADTVRGTQGEQERWRNTFAVALIALGVLALLANLGLFWRFGWGRLWPLLLVLIGVVIILGRAKRG